MNDEMFVLIEASKLSMDDEFMQYRPKNKREREFKDLLEEVIKNGIDDFWRPRMDPTLDEAGNICFKAGEKPVVDKDYNWWYKNAKKFNPERNSRLGMRAQYIAFLGVLIKALVAEGWKIKWAWNAVCNDSKKLGHYWDSKNAKHDLEPTGSRKIVGLCDLANTFKILADEEDFVFWIAGGRYSSKGSTFPLAALGRLYCYDDIIYEAVGWIVMD